MTPEFGWQLRTSICGEALPPLMTAWSGGWDEVVGAEGEEGVPGLVHKIC